MNKTAQYVIRHQKEIDDAISVWHGNAWKALMIIVMRATRLRKLENINAACDEFLFSADCKEARSVFFTRIVKYWTPT